MCRFTLTFNRNYRCTALHRTVSEILALVYELAPIDRSAVSAVRWETRSTILIYTDKPTGNVLSNHDSFSPLITGSRVQKNVLLDVLSYRGWGLRTSTGQRSFAFHVPSIWKFAINSAGHQLVVGSIQEFKSIQVFKGRLKTYLFGRGK